MIIVDRMLVSGIRWVLEKVVAAAEAELDDAPKLREELLAAQMRVELGEITEDEYRDLEKGILARLREIQERQKAQGKG